MVKFSAFIILMCMGLSIMTSCDEFKINQEEVMIVTEDIDDYNSAEYPLEAFDVFLGEIPDEANVISYHYRKVYSSKYDICLEMSFDTTEQIDSYILKIKEKFLNNHSEDPIVQQYGWAINEENPHDSKYSDIFLTYIQKESNHLSIPSSVGYWYITDSGSPTPRFSGYFQLISYSYEELTVRQFYTATTIVYSREDSVKFTPQYFLKFNVSLDKSSWRIFPLNYGY